MGVGTQATLVLLVLFSLTPSNGQRIAFVGPEVFRPGLPYEGSLSSLVSIGNLLVTMSIINNNTGAQVGPLAEATLTPGAMQTFSISTPADVDLAAKYKIRVVEASYTNETEIKVEQKSRSLFITTDKSIYKPGAKVMFRAFAVKSDLKPLLDAIDVEIYDPAGNKIKQWLGQTSQHGVVSGELQLSSQTPLGDWKIKVTSRNEEENIGFKVDEYTLPRFDVDITSNPSFLVNSKTNNIGLTIRVTAKYNIGTDVDGDLLLIVKARNDYWKIPAMEFNRKIVGVQTVDITYEAGTFTQCRICEMEVEARVTETLTGESRNATTKFTTYPTPYDMEFMRGPQFLKAGLKSRFQLKITQRDGTPVADVGKLITVDIRETITGRPRSEPLSRTFSIPSNGIATIEHVTTKNTTYLSLQASYDGESTSTSVGQTFKTRSDNSIEIDQITPNPGTASELQFQIRGTEALGRVYYQIISKKNVVVSGSQDVQAGSLNTDVYVVANTFMAPRATVLVFYITASGEMIAATETFEISFSLNNEMTLSWSALRTKVNENVNLDVTADPNSYVAVSAVDQSVLLLGEANDITMEGVIDELENYDRTNYKRPCCGFGGRVMFRRRRSFIFPGWYSASDTGKLLKATGLVYMTDAFVYNEPPMNVPIFFRGVPRAFPPAQDDSPSAPTRQQVRVRSFFPESWIWMNSLTGVDGRASFNVTVPDTLTSWVATAFALHPTSGLGIPPQKANLTAFQPFFMSVDKPYSIVRGEEVTIKVIVFNYLGSDIDATVDLALSDEFMVKESMTDTAASKALRQTVRVTNNRGASVSFIIIPQKLGQIILPLRASTANAQDAIEEPLLVEPEGREMEENEATFIDLSNTGTFTKSFTIDFPSDGLVAGSRFVIVNVIGDIMGTTLSGLDNLIRMPYGCGEQNMLSFSPNIVVRKYLESTGTITEKARTDTTTFMEFGYQRELTYQRTEGSFSAFGNSDKAGSTWLTSFVVQMFKEAQPYIFIDDQVLIKGLAWIIQNAKTKSGTYREVGNVIHKEMQGGSAGDATAMTAYVLIALEGCRELNQSVPQLLVSIGEAREYLEGQVASTTNSYKLAIMLYALQISGSTSANTVLQKLQTQATVENGVKYWVMPSDAKVADTGRRPFHHTKSNNEVEMASFVLLTLVQRGDTVAALPIAKYLMSVKNPRGGFFSTQDTIWGIKALAEFSALTQRGGKNFRVDVTVGSNPTKQFSVTSQNSQVLQKQIYSDADAEIDSNMQQVQIIVNGQGSGLVEVAHKYHTTMPLANPVVVINVQTTKPTDTSLVFTACMKLTDASVQDMFVMEMNDPTGFPVDSAGIEKPATVKRVEKDGKKNIVYFGDIPANVDQCVVMRAFKTNDVERIQEPVARVYGYYTGSESSVSVALLQQVPNVTTRVPVFPSATVPNVTTRVTVFTSGAEASTSVPTEPSTAASSAPSTFILTILSLFLVGWLTVMM